LVVVALRRNPLYLHLLAPANVSQQCIIIFHFVKPTLTNHLEAIERKCELIGYFFLSWPKVTSMFTSNFRAMFPGTKVTQ
jgi:hypothetical protein